MGAGVDSVEHGTLIDGESMALMGERGTYLVPTLYVLNYIVEEGAKQGIPEEKIAKGGSVLAENDPKIRKALPPESKSRSAPTRSSRTITK